MTSAAAVDLSSSGGKISRSYEHLRQALATPFDLAGLDVSAYPAEDVELAVRFWRARILSEHRSVQVFTQLALQLFEVNAPIDAQAVVLRMAQDELVHTEICGEVLAAMGAAASVETDVSLRPLATHAGIGVLARTVRNVVYATCLSEMIAMGRLADSLDTAQDPAIRSVVRAILADEVMHGQFGFLYLDSLQGVLEARPDLRDDLAHYLVHAFAVLEAELAPPARTVPGSGAVALGVLQPARARDVFYGTVAEAIIPGLEARGIAAAQSWRERRRLA